MVKQATFGTLFANSTKLWR